MQKGKTLDKITESKDLTKQIYTKVNINLVKKEETEVLKQTFLMTHFVVKALTQLPFQLRLILQVTKKLVYLNNYKLQFQDFQYFMKHSQFSTKI